MSKGLVERNDGRDLDHKKPLSQGGSGGLANIRVTTPKNNRSYARNSDGSMKKRK